MRRSSRFRSSGRQSAQTSPDGTHKQGRSAEGRLQFLDLFSGCGGFTLGMLRAGFQCLAAIDFNREAVETLRRNLCETCHPQLTPVAHALERDLTKYPPGELATLIGTERVDVIIGGPPCQGFSTARQVDGANHGARLKEDRRRHLYREFLRYVDYFKPHVFVMENVLGLRTAAGGEYFTRLQKESRELGYRVHGQIEDAWELSVPQTWQCQLVIGVCGEFPGYFRTELRFALRVGSSDRWPRLSSSRMTVRPFAKHRECHEHCANGPHDRRAGTGVGWGEVCSSLTGAPN